MRKTAILLCIMGLMGTSFGQTEKKNPEPLENRELRLEYNVMKNIVLEKCKKYGNAKRFEPVGKGIYRDLKDKSDAKYRMTVSYELESNETNNQYPLEDVLDRYLIHVSDFLESENEPKSNTFKLEFGGYLDSLQKAKEIIGKRVFNREFIGDDGQIRVALVIE